MENVGRCESSGYKVKEKGFTNNTPFCILPLLNLAHCCRVQNESLGWFYVTEVATVLENFSCITLLLMFSAIDRYKAR